MANRSAAVFDSSTQESHARMQVVERTRQISSEALAHNIETGSIQIAPDGRFDVMDNEAQIGIQFKTEDFCKKLRQINTRFFFEVSRNYPDKMGAYMMLPDPYKPWQTAEEKRFIVGFENGWMPEFTLREWKWQEYPDTDNPVGTMKVREFKDQKRGWRTVLALLLKGGYIKAIDIKNHFPRLWRESQYWHQETT